MKHFLEHWNKSINIVDRYDLTFPLHLHEAAEFIMVEKGELTLHLFHEDFLLKPGSLAALFPGQLHGYTSLSPSTHIRMIIFHSSVVPDFLPELSHCHPSVPVISREELSPDVPFIFDRLYTIGDPPDSRLIAAWIGLLLATLLPQLCLKKNSDLGEADLLYRLTNYLSLHYTEDVSLDTLARKLHVNKYYLSHTLSDKLHMSLTDYVNQLRIDRAAQLLTTTTDSIQSVGAQSGFETQRTFNRVFKKQTGMTPNEFRAAKQP